MPRYTALLLAPLVGAIAGAVSLMVMLAEARGLGMFVLLLIYTYCIAVLGVPLIVVLAKFHRFTPLAVYLFGLVCAAAFVSWFVAFGLYPIAVAALITAVAATGAFNAIFFHRIAL
jgi:hypothetical protein